jgi:hypothetical protein
MQAELPIAVAAACCSHASEREGFFKDFSVETLSHTVNSYMSNVKMITSGCGCSR